MAEIVDEDLTPSFRNRTYNWKEWAADGRTRKLLLGQDYTEYASMVSAGRKWARDHGMRLRTRKVDDGQATLVQFVPKEDGE